MLRRLIAFPALAIGLLAALPAQAQPLLCEPEGAEPLSLEKLEADGILVSTRGQRYRLSGVLWPDTLEAKARETVHAALVSALRQEELSVKRAGPPDRWGIYPAHVFVREKDGSTAPFWLQAGLVEQGLMPAWPDLPELCWKTLMTHERLARRAHRGFWAPRAQAFRHRSVSQAPQEHMGRRMVARWRVFSTRKSQVLTYVNITSSFRVGPSIGLTARQVDMLSRQGHPPETLAGRKIIVRFLSGPVGLLRVRVAQGDALMPDED